MRTLNFVEKGIFLLFIIRFIIYIIIIKIKINIVIPFRRMGLKKKDAQSLKLAYIEEGQSHHNIGTIQQARV